ncbi:4-amino-4-deoxy-L-arabinose transferase-like glycosyltransferase [Nocardia tenerifensis]|uniref:4-amino-4-deoxy-L-arabinose transferase-like glycosyltransferase n=1 Tax=Nocardia tenerifensis TaxID=228006 RepID=A0A318JLM0_9NOCA|nr:glycosyltransferase family 39 protein [Nocardia tenerifensis]PXX54591.1 4-amino-4-deoxy-L-arabinose transferase-like glycosyltransferase [Nocardia tenerifensis]
MTTISADPALPDATDPTALPPARRWERAGLAALLISTAVAYLWRITVNGMGNNFYAAATWAGSRDWKALLFGSLDPGNFITVDKPPVSQWVMGLSGQLFGFSSASMLIPQALMAVAAVGLTYAAIARASGSRGAGLLAGAVLAVTPVVALMFRFNNPDAVMVLLMTAGAYCTVRSLRHASPRWLVLAGVALGFAFLAKMLEGLMVLPALGLAYLIVAPTTVRNRLWHLTFATLALIVSSGWYVLLTILWPASSRPYLAGSTNNTFMDLVLGYNGFARFLGHNHRGGGNRAELPPGYEMPHNAGGGFGGFGGFGTTGPWKLFTGEIGFEISWLLPAALLAFAIVLASRRRAPRTDVIRGAALVFGLWLVIDGIAFTTMQGGMHAYYTLAIGPAVAGTFALGVHEVWRRRDDAFGRIGSAALVLATGGWSFVLLARNADWLPWLRWTLLTVTVLAAVTLGVSVFPTMPARLRARATSVLMIAGLLAGLGGTSAYATATLPREHVGGSPTVGPAKPETSGPASQLRREVTAFLDGSTEPRVAELLRNTTTTWSAAVDRSATAASLELASRTPVIAIGGFTADDPVPTLPDFQHLVDTHQITYYLAQEVRLPDSWRIPDQPGILPHPKATDNLWRPSGNKEIADWVAAHYSSTHIGNVAIYDLTKPTH